METTINVSKKIALIAKAKGYTQKNLAARCNVSRITIHRFFNGQTQLKCNDLMNLLGILGIDVESQINFMLSNQSDRLRNAPVA